MSPLPFLDMLIYRIGTKIYSTWYKKPTDTDLVMNYHALSPRRYKQSVVAGFVHRIHRACSTWHNFHDTLLKAKCVFRRNQYHPEPMIQRALVKILNTDYTHNENENVINTEKKNGDESFDAEAQEPIRKKLVFFEYCRKVTDDYCIALKKIGCPMSTCLDIAKIKNSLAVP